jgi:hypothetical protein
MTPRPHGDSRTPLRFCNAGYVIASLRPDDHVVGKRADRVVKGAEASLAQQILPHKKAVRSTTKTRIFAAMPSQQPRRRPNRRPCSAWIHPVDVHDPPKIRGARRVLDRAKKVH